MIDPVALRSLVAVRDHGSVVGAAAALGFTPSAVSQHVKRLEAQSRQPMLERVGRGVVLTERARQLADRGAWLLAELDGLDRLVQSPDDLVAGTVRLATFATACRGLVAPLLPRLAESAPQLRLRVLEDDPREVVSAVARGRADLGIVHDWTSVRLDLPPDVDAAPLLVDRADMLVHRTHRLARRRRVTPADLVEEKWAITPSGTICHDWLLEMYAQHGMRPDLRYEADDYATHVALVAEDVAIALVPRLGRVVLPDSVVPVEVEDPVPERTVQLIWRRSGANSAALALVRRELEAVVAERWP